MENPLSEEYSDTASEINRFIVYSLCINTASRFVELVCNKAKKVFQIVSLCPDPHSKFFVKRVFLLA
jgi:hypothetical protein